MKQNLKRTLSVLLAVIMLFSIIPIAESFAANIVLSGQCGDNVYWTLDSNGTLTISGTGEMNGSPLIEDYRYSDLNVVINYGVTKICDDAFSCYYGLKSVTIPDSVTSIGDYAFSNTSIGSVTIPDSVTSIGARAFECSGIKSLTIPNSVTTIGDYAFVECNSLTSVTIGTGITSISVGAFAICYRLTKVTIPDSVTTIGRGAFTNYHNLTDVYYTGSREQWNKIVIDNYMNENDPLLNATIHYNDVSKVSSLKSSAQTASSVTLSWNKVKGADGYQIYKYDNSKKEYVKVKATTNTTYKVSDLKAGTMCKFKVRAYKKVGGLYAYGEYSSILSVSTKPAAVTSLKSSSAATSGVTLGWKKVTGATGYQVYKYDSAKKEYVKVKTVTGNSYKVSSLKAGTTYKFKVRAYKKVGDSTVYGEFSSVLSASTKPATVSSLKAKTQTTKTVTLSWKKVTGATGYQVYKYDSAKKEYVKVKTVTGTSYKVSSLKAGTTYKFKVRAYKKVGDSTVYGAFSSVLTTTTKPATPTLKVTAGSKKATISWKKISGATGYEIYMATSKNGTYKKIATIKKAATVKYTKTGLTKGKTYYFKVRAYKTVSKTNVYSAYSSVKSVKVK